MTDPLTRPCPDTTCRRTPGEPCGLDCASRWNDDMTTTDRAESAEYPLQAFANNMYSNSADQNLSNPESLDQAARDLVGNLCHLLDRAGINPGTVLANAYGMYGEELAQDAPGDTRPTAYRLACEHCAAQSGERCPWACPSWDLPLTTWTRSGTTPGDPAPATVPAPGYAVVPAPTLHRTAIELPAAPTDTPLSDALEIDLVVVSVVLDVSEEVEYTITANVTVPADVAADPEKLSEYLHDNEDAWLDELDPSQGQVNERELHGITIR
ncbi:hypothetical protein [Streptosporangium sp. NPDC048865]|uniref:hypothetical protein n=1 Tax=Streptosporangium sp. NPDC048865 TaxID=3155766 RepID=UPI00343A2F92